MVVAENRQGPTELVEEKLEMPLAQPVGGAGLHEPFARILADRPEEAVRALPGKHALHNHEGFPAQPRQQIEHVVLVDRTRTRAAANSMARGIPSRRRQIRAMASALSGVGYPTRLKVSPGPNMLSSFLAIASAP